MSLQELQNFVEQPGPPQGGQELTAVSLFSGAGLSDVGYALAGFSLTVQVEQEADRAAIGERNFPDSSWLRRDVRAAHEEIRRVYCAATNRPLDLLIATPPCQGMSSSNPSRGRRSTNQHVRQERLNKLILELIPVASKLRPRVVVAENVRPVLTLEVSYGGSRKKVIDHLRQGLPDYDLFTDVVNVADYGVPQDRRRAVVVGLRRDEPCQRMLRAANLAPLPEVTHARLPSEGRNDRWITIRQWMEHMHYESLDSASVEAAVGGHPLHYVPNYAANPDRYLQISEIPPNSGRSAYENETCPRCGSPVRTGVIKCPRGHITRNRPYVRKGRSFRLVRGFHSSYRRMAPDEPARTITTNTSHVGSDFKIHPWENRVLSALECADLQTVPRFFDWSSAINAKPRSKRYLIRNLIGEALPPYFTFLHGQVLAGLLQRCHAEATPSMHSVGQRIASDMVA